MFKKMFKKSCFALLLTSIQLSGFALTNQEIFAGTLMGQGSGTSTPTTGATVSQNQPTWRCIAKSALGGPQFQVTHQGTQQWVSQQAMSQCQNNPTSTNPYANPSCTATCTLVSGSTTYQATSYKPTAYQNNSYQAPAYNPNGAITPPEKTNTGNNTASGQSNQTTPLPPKPYQAIVAAPNSAKIATNSATTPQSQPSSNPSTTSYSNPYQQVMGSGN